MRQPAPIDPETLVALPVLPEASPPPEPLAARGGRRRRPLRLCLCVLPTRRRPCPRPLPARPRTGALALGASLWTLFGFALGWSAHAVLDGRGPSLAVLPGVLGVLLAGGAANTLRRSW